MDPYRTNKLNQAIREVLGQLVQSAVKDPRVGFVSINKVELNRDHSVARVHFSVMGDEEERSTSFKGLKKARGFLQGKVARTLGMRAVPELRFEYDDTMARGVELDGVLDKMEARGEFLSEEDKKRRMSLADLVPPTDLIEGLRRAKSLWIVPHWNPDPDAIGSALALAEALEAAGKDVRVVGYPEPPIGLDELPGFDRIASSDDAEELWAEDEPDALVIVDCHRIDRTGPLEDTLERFETRWTIDHHLVSGRKAPEQGWIEARSCSTCTLVHQVIEVLSAGDTATECDPFDLSLDMATNLYAGLLNDTGGFRFDNTMPFSFELAGRLSSAGVDTADVAARTLFHHRRQGLDMLQRVLATFEYHAGGRIVTARATLGMVEETGGSMSDTEGFVNMAMSVDGVVMAAFMKEMEDSQWRVSLRSRDGDVQTIAARHGGGGHLRAAGCNLSGGADDVAMQLVAEMTAALEE